MPLYHLSKSNLVPIATTTFAKEGYKERADLQRLLRDRPEVLEDGLFVISEEFGDWEDSSRRIDLLAVDSSGQLVVIELKRDEEAAYAELQSVRYAALVANMTFERVLNAHAAYLQKRGIAEGPRERLLAALAVPEGEEPNLESARPRILIVSADFSKELTTSVLWLNEVGIDMRCLRIRPYKLGEEVIVDVEQLIPLPETREYLVRARERAEEAETVSRSRRENTLATLIRNALVLPGTEIVFDARKGSVSPSDPKFLAKFSNQLNVQKNVIWEEDGGAYSLSALTEKLRNDGVLSLPRGALNGFDFWCLRSDTTKTLWALAEETGRQ